MVQWIQGAYRLCFNLIFRSMFLFWKGLSLVQFGRRCWLFVQDNSYRNNEYQCHKYSLIISTEGSVGNARNLFSFTIRSLLIDFHRIHHSTLVNSMFISTFTIKDLTYEYQLFVCIMEEMFHIWGWVSDSRHFSGRNVFLN